ncbi:hypothetical protein K7432_018335 [Basidiobolus ranarum]|uniref:Uncharacterized protein n=1 Tax=Basidiobolus ranarum TaxID=34480 RepID=A0ABR2WCB4_9FUNG
MHFTLNLLFTSAVLAKLSISAPLSARSSRYSNEAEPHLDQLEGNSQGQSSSLNQPSYTDGQLEQSPLLRQVFTTKTRIHNNLNEANISNQKNSDIKYQSGPSFEAEGTEAKSSQGELADPDSDAGASSTTETPTITQGNESGLPIRSSENVGSESTLPIQQLGGTLSQSLPQRALLDQVRENSAQTGHALSDSNQFDQVQRIEQTLYQPSQNSEPPQISDDQESDDSDSTSGSSGCSRCGCRRRHRGRRYRFGRRC